MKMIIGFILLYIILVISSASLFKLIMSPYKGTKLEETWKSSLKKSSIVNFIAGIFIIMIFSIFHFCF